VGKSLWIKLKRPQDANNVSVFLPENSEDFEKTVQSQTLTVSTSCFKAEMERAKAAARRNFILFRRLHIAERKRNSEEKEHERLI
jgi:hypothetical protein